MNDEAPKGYCRCYPTLRYISRGRRKWGKDGCASKFRSEMLEPGSVYMKRRPVSRASDTSVTAGETRGQYERCEKVAAYGGVLIHAK